MNINPALPSGHTIFCDDIRQEITGKITLVGVYSSVMFVAEMPTVLPKFCCWVNYRDDPREDCPPADLRIIYETEDEEVVVAQAQWEYPTEFDLPPAGEDGFLMREFRMFFELSAFAIKQPGKLKVRMFRGDDEVRIGIMHVKLAPTPEETPG